MAELSIPINSKSMGVDVMFRTNANDEWRLYANGILTIKKVASKTTYTMHVNDIKFEWYWKVNKDGSTTSIAPRNLIANLLPEKYVMEYEKTVNKTYPSHPGRNSLKTSVNGELHEAFGNLELKTIVKDAKPNSSRGAMINEA
ncbi:MAG: hypothetical protein AB2826_27305 [Candidatus Thiodiazotropha sp.]